MRPLWALPLRPDVWETRPKAMRGFLELLLDGDRKQRRLAAKFLSRWLGELEATGEVVRP
jgi:hypothetical protein